VSDHVNYDKAKWHHDGVFPGALDFFQAHVHIGMMLGWLIDRDFISDSFREDFADSIAAFKRREMTGPQVLEQACGCLNSEMLDDDGNDFVGDYYNRQGASYFHDFEEILSAGLPSCYHVEDNWANYELLKARIDMRYDRWLRGER
jgi:hypothetical protein